MEWDTIRGLWAPPHLLSKKAKNIKKFETIKNIDPSIPTSKLTSTERVAERKSRMMSDGCLIPRGGSEHLRALDGTYEKPIGGIPKGMEWDTIRGLWAPPHLLSKKAAAPTADEPPLAKRRRIRLDHQADTNDNREQDSDDNDESNSKDEKGKKINDRFADRRSNEGFLKPKRQSFTCEDGTYQRPKGHTPKNMVWDSYRGRWVPEKKYKKRKFGSDSSSSSSSTSSGGEDAMIIKASKAKLFHHSSTFLRTYLSPKKKKKRKGQSMYNSLSFQARTKSNPSGIVNHTINLNNWRKIEKLMQRARKQRSRMGASSSSSPGNDRNAHGDEGAVLV